MDGKYRRLLFLTIISLTALLLAGCTPAAPPVAEPCPTPVNLPLEDEPEAAPVPAFLEIEADLPVIPEASPAEQPVTAAPKPSEVPDSVVATPPVETTAETGPPEAEPLVVAGPPPVVVAHTPGQGAGVEWSQDIRILFSASMDRAATEQAISVTPGIDYSVSWHRDGKMIRLVPTELLVAFQWYEVTVSADAAAAGGARLGTPYSFSFQGEEP